MDTRKKLFGLIRNFRTAMLVTHDGEQIDARPMAIIDVEDDGTIWFATDRTSGKTFEVAENCHVAVTMQDSKTFVSVSGNAALVTDRLVIEQKWSEPLKVWFPGGKEDQNLILLKVIPSIAQYWDNSGLSGIKYLFEAGKAYLKGERPHIDDSINATVKL